MMIRHDWFMTPITLSEHTGQEGFGQQVQEDSEGQSGGSKDFQQVKLLLRRQMLNPPDRGLERKVCFPSKNM